MATEQNTDASGATTTLSELSLLDRIVLEGKMVIEPSQNPYAKKLLGQFAAQILDEGMKTSPDKGVVAMINERVAEIDKILTDQINAIMHHAQFQALDCAIYGISRDTLKSHQNFTDKQSLPFPLGAFQSSFS